MNALLWIGAVYATCGVLMAAWFVLDLALYPEDLDRDREDDPVLSTVPRRGLVVLLVVIAFFAWPPLLADAIKGSGRS